MTTWIQVRAHYAKLFAEAQARDGATQQSVSRRGSLKGQNAISKLLKNTKRGPSVDTFIKAVEGLGLDVRTFFSTLDIQASAPGESTSSPALENRRVSDGPSSSSTPVGSLVISTRIEQVPAQPLDLSQFDTIVRQHIDALARKLGYGAQSVGSGECVDATADRRPTARRGHHRRRARKTA